MRPTPNHGIASRVNAAALSSVPAVAVAALIPPTAPVAGAITAGLGAIVLAGWVAIFNRQYSQFIAALERETARTNTFEDFQDYIRQRSEADPAYAERNYQVLVRVRDTFCDDAVSAMGILAAEYTSTTPIRPPDAFFRGMLAVLSSVDSTELTDLRRLVIAIPEHESIDERDHCIGVVRGTCLSWQLHIGDGTAYSSVESPIAYRIVQLLRTDGLAESRERKKQISADKIDFDYSTCLTMSANTVARLRKILAG